MLCVWVREYFAVEGNIVAVARLVKREKGSPEKDEICIQGSGNRTKRDSVEERNRTERMTRTEWVPSVNKQA